MSLQLKYQRILLPTAYVTAKHIVLPPLTKSSKRLDVEIYSLLALVVRDFINTWLQQITTDPTFVQEVLVTIGRVIRTIEKRLQEIDIVSILLKDLPLVLLRHVKDYRMAIASRGTVYAPNMSMEEAFHSLQPHFALPDRSEEYLQLLTDEILRRSLPPQDIESHCTRHLVREIIYNLVLKNALDKVSEPFMLHEMIIKGIENALKTSDTGATVSGSIWSRVQTTTRSLISAAYDLMADLTALGTTNLPPRQHNLDGPLAVLLVELFRIQDRQGWLLAQVQLFILPIVRGLFGPLLDRVIVRAVNKQMLSEDKLVQYLTIARETLWPKGAFMKPLPPPTPEQQVVLRQRAENMLFDFLPRHLRSQLLGSSVKQQKETIHDAFETISNKECNQHLVFFLLDLIVGNLFPDI